MAVVRGELRRPIEYGRAPSLGLRGDGLVVGGADDEVAVRGSGPRDPRGPAHERDPSEVPDVLARDAPAAAASRDEEQRAAAHASHASSSSRRRSLAEPVAEMLGQERRAGGRRDGVGPVERREEDEPVSDRHRHTRLDVPEQIGRREGVGQEVGRPGGDGLGEDRGMDAEVRVRGPQEAVQVDVLDDRHGRRLEPASRGQTPDERFVWPAVLLTRVVLDDEVDVGPGTVQQSVKGVRDVEPAVRRPVGAGQHDHPFAGPNTKLGPEGRGVRLRSPLDEVEARRARDAHLLVAVNAALDQDVTLPRPEHVRPIRQSQARRSIAMDVAVVAAVDHPVLDRDDLDALGPRRGQPVLPVVLVGEEHACRSEAPEEGADVRDRADLGGHPAGGEFRDPTDQRGAQVHAVHDDRRRDLADGGDPRFRRAGVGATATLRFPGAPDRRRGQEARPVRCRESVPPDVVVDARLEIDLDGLEGGAAERIDDRGEVRVDVTWPVGGLDALARVFEDHQQATGLAGEGLEALGHRAATGRDAGGGRSRGRRCPRRAGGACRDRGA